MQIIPALYIKEGRAAAYRPGDDAALEFLPQDPYDLIDLIGTYEDISRIHLIDMDAVLPGEKNNCGLVGSLANTTVPDLEAGGGINDMEYLKSLQYAGVDYFVLGTVVFENFAFLEAISQASDIKNDRIMIAIDLMDGQLTYHGWTESVEDQNLRNLIRRCLEVGFHRFIITDVDSTHPEKGPDLLFYKELVEQFPEAIFAAAGNIITFQDVDDLKQVGVREVIVGDEIYKEEGLLEKIAAYNKENA